MIHLSEVLAVPDGTKALLLDLDGVVLDSLKLDLELVPPMIDQRWPGRSAEVTAERIRRGFGEPVSQFWRSLLLDVGISVSEEDLEGLIHEHEQVRASHAFDVLPGVRDVIAAARGAGLSVAIVSNNNDTDIASMLEAAGMAAEVDEVIGLGRAGGVPKPDPTIYREAARLLGVETQACVAIEDSLEGLASASSAGCRVVAVTTGGLSFDELEAAGAADWVVLTLGRPEVAVAHGDPRDKDLASPNEFVTHMVEHIMWRVGVGGRVFWPSDDWVELGEALGRAIAPSLQAAGSVAVLGMIDDGSCETKVTVGSPTVVLSGAYDVDVDWFLGLAAEQVASGQPLVDLLTGLSRGTGTAIEIRVCSLEDPHHTWEGVFRSVGMCLARLVDKEFVSARHVTVPRPPAGRATSSQDGVVNDVLNEGFGWTFADIGTGGGTVERSTAESVVLLTIDPRGEPGCDLDLKVSDSIAVSEFRLLLDQFATEAGMRISVVFQASFLSSSHVVFEDIGLALGKLLIRIAQERWRHVGMAGAGSSVVTPEDLEAPTRVAVSIEGRKFWKFVALDAPFSELRRQMLVGQTVFSELRSEDLDDFVDGLAGGLGASIMVHVASFEDPSRSWLSVFAGLGRSIASAFEADPMRLGLPPGVKATLV